MLKDTSKGQWNRQHRFLWFECLVDNTLVIWLFGSRLSNPEASSNFLCLTLSSLSSCSLLCYPCWLSASFVFLSNCDLSTTSLNVHNGAGRWCWSQRSNAGSYSSGAGVKVCPSLKLLPKRPDCPGDIFIKMQVAMLFLKFYWKETIVAAMQVSFIKVHAAPSVSSGIWVLVRCLRAFEDEAVCLHHMASHPVCQLLSFWCCRSCGGPQVVASSLDPHWPWCAIETGAGVLSLWTNALSWLRMCILSVVLYRLVDKNDACCQAWIPSEQLRTNMSLPCFWHLWAPWYFIQEQTHPLRLPVLLKGGWSCWELLWSSCQVLFLIQIGPFTEAQNSLGLEAQRGYWGQLSWFWLTSQVYFSVERHCHK